MAEETKEEVTTTSDAGAAEATPSGEGLAEAQAAGVDAQPGNATGTEADRRGRRAEKIGVVASDKMQKTVVVRVDRLIKHPKYRRYVRRTTRFMAHDEQGATVGDKVRIVETRPLSSRKRWRVVEIIQKAAK
jgi:small subunit ribosomal protein S17